jgi:hypothetical protein
MEIILLAVTVGSLLLAFIMSAAAWRMSRQERARASARIAALAAAADMHADEPVSTAAAHAAPVPVADELPLRPALKIVDNAPAPRVVEEAVPLPDVFDAPGGFLRGGAVREQGGGRQRGLMVAAAVLFVVLGGAAYWLISGNASPHATATAAENATAPLELISLRHERQGSRLSLSGLVRNPTGGTPIDALTAVVFLFDANGGFISSARAGVDFKRLGGGDESPFVISMDAPSSVARYRVSFRTDAGVVAHVDRRGEQPVATAIVR